MLSAPSGGQFAWRMPHQAIVTLTDGNGQVVPPLSVSCLAGDVTQVTVSADCSQITVLRIGSLAINVQGGGVNAVLTVTGVPQRQWTGVHGAQSSEDYALVANADGSVLAWGGNLYGVLDQNADVVALTSLPVPTLTLDATGQTSLAGVFQVSAGTDNAAALRRDGSVLAWGSNNSYALGNSTTINSALLPVGVRNLTNSGALSHVAQVEMGGNRGVALIDDGSVVAWGQWPGDGTVLSTTLPTRVMAPGGATPLSGIVAVSAGWSHSLALTADGHVVAWGYDLSRGALGASTLLSSPQALPNRVKRADGTDLAGIVQISAGYIFSLALADDGTVWAWGDNAQGQLGQGVLNTVSPVAVQVKTSDGAGTLSAISMVAAGGSHSLALTQGGQLLGWGLATKGQLGDGPNRPAGNQSTLPRPITVGPPASTSVKSITAGYSDSFALIADGTVSSWGGNFHSALGRVTTTSSDPSPLAVVGVGGTGSLHLDLSSYPNLLRHAR